ncbi:hypothetical protein LIER_33519 [Lithospermum erythrorhizon]|uniref:DUF1685 family protein n=1 Tax=Lithospermum erythrorhizon TaxID=34254 RepID=A0AAV3RWW7_LITER
MDAEAVINLFDSCWFCSRSNSSPSIPKNQHQNHPQNQEIYSNPNVFSPLTIKTTSRNNDQSLNSIYTDVGASLSPNSVLFESNLETNFSCKQEMEKMENFPSQEKKFQSRMRRKIKKGKSKSLSELECEEVKGFMDLGFVFSEEDRHSNLVEMIPGLQRLGKEKHDNKNGTNNNIESSVIMRPYLSEAWSVLDKQKVDKSLMKWRIPTMSSENDIKLNLKWWAHTVASSVVG